MKTSCCRAVYEVGEEYRSIGEMLVSICDYLLKRLISLYFGKVADLSHRSGIEQSVNVFEGVFKESGLVDWHPRFSVRKPEFT